jgi:tRNA G18 (ribose-2'-O)-methylase SpoU
VAAPIPIEDPSDPRIAPFQAVRERDISGRAGGFIAEGEVVLRVLLRSARHRVRSLLLAERRADKLAPLLEGLPDDVPIYTAGQSVMDSIAGFPIHRGILAYGERAPKISAGDLLGAIPSAEGAVVLVLFGISNHDNIGGLFRNAAAFGVRGVLLDPTCCDPLYRKAIRVSVGAALAMPFARLARDDDPLTLLKIHGFTALALSPSGATRLVDLPSVPRAAVLLGAEGPGLPPAILARARAVGIPMAGSFDSLNVAVTGGIVLHHLAFHRS